MTKLLKHRVITFDGTAGSGKGSIAKRVAEHYGYAYLDTGKLYRGLALVVIRSKAKESYADNIADFADSINSDLLLDKELYNEEVSEFASKIAADPLVRKALLDFQREFLFKNKNAVLDGRDTGSVICPEANCKFYIDADVKVRAERRYMQNKQYYENKAISVADIEENINDRDNRDKNRDIAPLIIPEGATEVDNSSDSLDVTVKKVIEIIDYS